MKTFNRRCTIWLVLALLILAFLFLPRIRPRHANHSLEGDLAPYQPYLQAHSIAPEDVLSYTLIESDGKTTLQLTLQSAGEHQRIVSISVKSGVTP